MRCELRAVLFFCNMKVRNMWRLKLHLQSTQKLKSFTGCACLGSPHVQGGNQQPDAISVLETAGSWHSAVLLRIMENIPAQRILKFAVYRQRTVCMEPHAPRHR